MKSTFNDKTLSLIALADIVTKRRKTTVSDSFIFICIYSNVELDNCAEFMQNGSQSLDNSEYLKFEYEFESDVFLFVDLI